MKLTSQMAVATALDIDVSLAAQAIRIGIHNC